MNSLGIDKAPADTRVVVAMSGGVDSSVVAALLKAEGYDVVGITLQLYDHGAAVSRKGACCAGADIHDARSVADRLGIPHYVLDYEDRFRESVMDDFADSYLRGETPIPCVRCNQTVKFRDLLKTAHDLGAEALATGHYVQRQMENGRAQLYRGADMAKDQSYFLFATTQEQLDFLRFPLGALNKEETRRMAAEFGLIVSDKPDSQDICFVPNGDYRSVIRKMRPHAFQPGEMVSLEGTVLGRHDGIINYTVGQRRGLGIAGGEPLYVVRIEAKENRVIVGPKQALANIRFAIEEVNWLGEMPSASLPVMVKMRSSQMPVEAMMHLDAATGRAEVELDMPQYAVTPGQACVAYDGNRLLGGGWITRKIQ